MTYPTYPPMEPLAPIVDRMRHLAVEELPDPQSCKVRLWDDGTFDVLFYHGTNDDRWQWLRYERSTSEILCGEAWGKGWRTEELSGGKW
jgi:hypothetical protein